MTDFVPYEPGTIEVTNGSKNIVGTGTDFSVYSGGDTIWVDGYPVLLDGDPSSDTAALAKYNYLGTSGSGKSYRWVPLGDLSRAIALDTRLSSYFTSGNLSAEAGLTGAADVISYYTGVGTKAVTAFTAAARTVLDDTTVAAMRTTLFDVSTTVDNRIARYDGTAGALQNSAITVDDSGNVSGVGTLNAAGVVTVGGLYNVGLLTLDAGQIAMPATQNASAGANTWDDYEEGTWTPAVTAGSGSYTSITANTGKYVKNGKAPTIQGTWTISTIGTGNSGTNVGSLPFTGDGQEYGGSGVNFSNGIGLSVLISATNIYVVYADGNNAAVNGHRYSIDGVYFV